MGCGSSSLKGTEDVGTSPDVPAVKTENPLQPASTGAPVRKVKTNFSTIDYDAPAESKKSALLKARAPDELDEGPSRNASHVDPMNTTVNESAPKGDLPGETGDGIMEKAQGAGENKLEPYHTIEDESVPGKEGQLVGGKTPGFVQ